MYKDEFPDYDDELWIPDGFKDVSWHNDTCPHVEKRYFIDVEYAGSEDIEVVTKIWQDYKDPEKREYETAPRYSLLIEISYQNIFFYQTNNVEEIKKMVTENRFNWRCY